MIAYDVHGLGLAVDGVDDIGRAIDRRLHGFPRTSVADLELRYVTDLDAAVLTTPDAPSRSVYEAGGSEVRHFPEPGRRADRRAGGRDCTPTSAPASRTSRARASAAARATSPRHPFATLALLEMVKRRRALPARGVPGAGGTRARSSSRAPPARGSRRSRSGSRAPGLITSATTWSSCATTTTRCARSGSRTRSASPPDGSAAPRVRGAGEVGRPTRATPKYLARVEDDFDVRVVTGATLVAIVFRRSCRETRADSNRWRRRCVVRRYPDVLLTESAATQAHLTTIAALTAQVGRHTLLAGGDLDASCPSRRRAAVTSDLARGGAIVDGVRAQALLAVALALTQAALLVPIALLCACVSTSDVPAAAEGAIVVNGLIVAAFYIASAALAAIVGPTRRGSRRLRSDAPASGRLVAQLEHLAVVVVRLLVTGQPARHRRLRLDRVDRMVNSSVSFVLPAVTGARGARGGGGGAQPRPVRHDRVLRPGDDLEHAAVRATGTSSAWTWRAPRSRPTATHTQTLSARSPRSAPPASAARSRALRRRDRGLRRRRLRGRGRRVASSGDPGATAAVAGVAVLIVGGALVSRGDLSLGSPFAFYAVVALMLRQPSTAPTSVPRFVLEGAVAFGRRSACSRRRASRRVPRQRAGRLSGRDRARRRELRLRRPAGPRRCQRPPHQGRRAGVCGRRERRGQDDR